MADAGPRPPVNPPMGDNPSPDYIPEHDEEIDPGYLADDEGEDEMTNHDDDNDDDK